MTDATVETLLLPFTRGLLALPGHGRGFMIRAESHPALDENWRRALICEQTLKPAFDRLEAAGFVTETRLHGKFSVGLCVLTKHKLENMVNIARGWELLEPGGILVCAGSNDIGAKSIEGRIRDVAGVHGSMSKNHCRVFWTRRAPEIPDSFSEWLEMNRLCPNVDALHLTRPGVFSWDRVDEGSRFLVDLLPSDISGDVADLGAGWGYISSCILARFPDVRTLDLYEAELLALDAARSNLVSIPATARVGFHWYDLTKGLPEGRQYDRIIMNPPFHSGRQTAVDLGRAFIESAAKGLRPGGNLILVANRQLSYEAELKARFTRFRCLAEERGFKVLSAWR